jgi:glycerophosphoryl diester phosphodiesterase
MLIICHRGYHASTRENTLEAFAKASVLGADGIETDVRLSADGLPILFHDRMVSGGIPVASLTRVALSRVVGYHVPTLEEALDQEDRLLWNVEIKTVDAVEATIETLRRYLTRRQLLVTSFRHDAVLHASEQLHVESGVLVDHRPYDVASFLESLPRNEWIKAVVWDYETIDPDVVAAVARAGLKSLAYGAESLQEHRRCVDLELAAVITDIPHLVVTGGPT